MKKTKRVGIYARTSTDDGRQDVEVQLRQLRDYCHQRGLEVLNEYRDEITGVTENRPAFTKLMNDARKRRLDCVLVFRFDRFARSTKTLIDALEEFRQLGVEFISFTENIDTGTSLGRCMYTIIAAFAAMEREIIRERVMAGLQNARANGVRLGRPRKGFDIGRALELKAKGYGVRRIAKRLGVSHGTVHNYLTAVHKTHGGEDAVSVQ